MHAIDDGTVGTEARLIAGKTLIRLERPAEAIPLLEAAAKVEAAAGRAQLGLALAQFAAGNRAAAEEALGRALESNAHYGKALLGQIRRRVDNVVGTPPGSREEAVVYAQTYGDVWDDAAKKFLDEALAARAARARSAGPEAASPAG